MCPKDDQKKKLKPGKVKKAAVKKVAVKKAAVKKVAVKKAVVKKVAVKKAVVKKAAVKKVAVKKAVVKKVAVKKAVVKKAAVKKAEVAESKKNADVVVEDDTVTSVIPEPAVLKSAQEMAKVMDATQLYLSEIGFSPLLTAEEEVHYSKLALKGDESGRKTMIESNLRLVVKISRRYLNRGLPLLDLIEEGNLGLMKSVEKFDPDRGFRFSTYATWWIRQTIERALMNQTRTIRLPIHVVKELNVYLRAARKLTQQLDHEPSAEEIAERVDKPLEDVRRLLGLNDKIASVDTPIGHDENKSLLDTIPDENSVNPAEMLTNENLRAHIESMLDELPTNQQEVIARRFGLRGFEKATLEEVGREISLTRERVRQIQVEALKTLRRLLENVGLSQEDLF